MRRYNRNKPKGILVNFLLHIETGGAGANAKAHFACFVFVLLPSEVVGLRLNLGVAAGSQLDPQGFDSLILRYDMLCNVLLCRSTLRDFVSDATRRVASRRVASRRVASRRVASCLYDATRANRSPPSPGGSTSCSQRARARTCAGRSCGVAWTSGRREDPTGDRARCQDPVVD